MSFRNNQAWLSLADEDGNYVGNLHVINRDVVKRLRKEGENLSIRFVLGD